MAKTSSTRCEVKRKWSATKLIVANIERFDTRQLGNFGWYRHQLIDVQEPIKNQIQPKQRQQSTHPLSSPALLLSHSPPTGALIAQTTPSHNLTSSSIQSKVQFAMAHFAIDFCSSPYQITATRQYYILHNHTPQNSVANPLWLS